MDATTTDPSSVKAALGGDMSTGLDRSTMTRSGALQRRASAEREAATVDKEGQQLAAEQKGQFEQFQRDHQFPHPDVKPWTGHLPQPDPVRSFGSIASALGILASALTRTPLTSALNASASAMKAIRSNDISTYLDAKRAWKDNAEVAYRNAEWEAAGYQSALDLMKTDWNRGWAAWQTHAAATQNKAAMAMQDAQSAQQYAMGMANLSLRLKAIIPKMQEQADDFEVISDSANHMAQDYTAKTGRQPTQVQMAEFRTQARNQLVAEKARAKYAGLMGDAAGTGAGGTEGEGSVDTLAHRAGLTTDALDVSAINWLLTRQLPFSKFRGSAQNSAVMDRGAALAKEAGLSPEEISALPQTKKAEVSTYIKDVQAYDGLSRSMDAMERLIPIVRDYANKVGTTRIQSINDMILAGKTEFGDPDANAYANAMTTLAQQVGRIMAGGQQSVAMTPVAALRTGMDRLAPKMSIGQFEEEAKLLEKEGRAQIDAARKTMSDRKHSLVSIGSMGGGGGERKAYSVGDIIEHGDKKYRVTGGDPTDPDVEPIQ